MEKLQAVWEAKDLDGFLSMFTEDAVVRVLHENKTLEGEEREKRLTEMLLDEDTVSSDFRIVYENDECAVTHERISGEHFGAQVSIVQLWRGGQVYHMEVGLVNDDT
tara:strand:- start:230 stop:550 length:321 start_codon:yes stop_codon:yes gene_type:complete